MALSIGFRIISFLPSCYSSYGALDSYPGGTLTHCSCQPSLDAHFSFLIPAHCTSGTVLCLLLGCAADSRPRVKCLGCVRKRHHLCGRLENPDERANFSRWHPIVSRAL